MAADFEILFVESGSNGGSSWPDSALPYILRAYKVVNQTDAATTCVNSDAVKLCLNDDLLIKQEYSKKGRAWKNWIKEVFKKSLK